MTETYYKVLAADGVSPQHGGSGKWFLPKGNRPGKWMPKIADIVPCQRGYHFVTLAQLPQWLGPSLYTIEVRGKVIAVDDKSVAEQARLLSRVSIWNEKTQRLFACDCAERVLSIYEKKYPNDARVRNAIDVSRKFANGHATIDELKVANAAANAAAYAAAYAAAANAAAYAAAAYAADVANAAVYAADVAYAAERKWQSERLAFYLEIR